MNTLFHESKFCPNVLSLAGFRAKLAVADYDVAEPADKAQRELRRLKNARYDKDNWVLLRADSETTGIGREDETLPELLIPAEESNLIFVGEVTKMEAFLSNDKAGIYTEFTIKTGDILKNKTVLEIHSDAEVKADRDGGVVRYPNGREIAYLTYPRPLPTRGGVYLFFLKSDKVNPNYRIITLYQLEGEKIIQMETGRSFEAYKNDTRSSFLEAVKKEIAHPTQKLDDKEISGPFHRRTW